MFKTTILIIITAIPLAVSAQITDAFDDGDFTSNPVWSGQHSIGTGNPFEIVEADNQLKSQDISGGSGTRISYLSTPEASQVDLSTFDAQWSFRLKNDFTFSGTSGLGSTNHSRVYLMSDATDLSGDVDGYYLQLRDVSSGDEEVRLFRQIGTTSTEVTLDGTLQAISSQTFVDVVVTRSTAGVWEVSVNGNSQGSGSDDTHTTTDYFGVQIRYSANSRSDLFFFDDFVTSYTPVADTDPPTIATVAEVSPTEIRVDFSEDVDQSTAENTANYSIDNGIDIAAAVRDGADNSLVALNVNALTSGVTYTITVNNVEDLNGNAILANSESLFEYIELSSAGARDVVINELMIDPSPVVGLPEAEFIELYNPTDKFFQLEDWAISDDNSPSASERFGCFILRPDSYVIICDDADESLFTGFGDVIAVSNLGALTNSGDDVVLSDAAGSIIDEITYTDAPSDGVTYEQVNPFLPCQGTFNFVASTDADGGTPGAVNSVFDDSPDEEPPTTVGIEVFDGDSLVLSFSEAIDPSTVSTGSFIIEGFTATDATVSAYDVVSLQLDVPLESEASHEIGFTGITDCSGNQVVEAFGFYYDVTPPAIEEIIIATDQSIFVLFDEPIDESSAEDEDNYLMDQSIGVPSRATLQDTTSNRVLLTFEGAFSLGLTYTLTYAGVEDTLDNAAASTDESFDFLSEMDSVLAITSSILQIAFSEVPSFLSATNVDNYLLDDTGRPNEVIVANEDSSAFRLVFAEAFDDNEDLLLYVEGVKTKASDRKMVTPAFAFRFDTDAPSIEEIEPIDSKRLLIRFDELIEATSAENLSFYQLEDDAYPIDASAEDSTVVLTFAEEFIIEETKTLAYTRIADLYGNFSTSNRRVDFVYDPRAPQLVSASKRGSKALTIETSEIVQFDSLKLTDFTLDGVSPVSLTVEGPDSVMLILGFADPFTEEEALELTIEDWQDLRGNRLPEPLTASINTRDPRIVSLTASNDSTLDVTFSEPMGTAAFNKANYSLESLTITELVGTGDTAVSLVVSPLLTDGENYVLRTNGFMDEASNLLQVDTASFQYETYLLEIEAVDSLTIILSYETEFTSVTAGNFLVAGLSPQLAALDPDNASSVQLVLTSPHTEDEYVAISWSDLQDKYGRELPDHQRQFIIDTRAPTLSSVTSDYDGEIVVTFSESVEEAAMSAPSQFSIVNIGQTSQLEFLNDATVSLLFVGLAQGTDYQLVAQNLEDEQGNTRSSDTLAFTYGPPAIAPVGSIIISEIMADPSPSKGLPEQEYIELFNQSDQSYSLRALLLARASDEVQLPNVILGPGEYVTLVDAGAEGLFESPNVVGVSGLFSLPNNGDSIALKNRLEEVLDVVEYELSWYHDSDKDDGGYSLELINPESDCGDATNWLASESDIGGTPGLQNSVFSLQPDTDAPLIVTSSLLDPSTLEVVFHEEMDPSTLIPSNFSQALSGLTVSQVEIDPSYERVVLAFATEIPAGEGFSLQVANVTDCHGNPIEPVSIAIARGAQPQFLDLLITEIFADPDPMIGLPDAEYLEIQNVSGRLLSLDAVRVKDEGGLSQAIGGIIAPGEILVLAPSGELVEFDNIPVRGVGSWRSLANGGERMALVSEEESLIFRLDYAQDWHDQDKRDGGYSLEMRDTGNPCGLASNWGSSIDRIGGTPGSTNSIQASVPDNFGPRLLSAFALTEDSVRLDFDENLSPFANGSVEITRDISVTEMTIYEDMPSHLFLSLSPALQGSSEYLLTTNDIGDCLGNARDDNEAVLVLPVEAIPGDVLLSEVLFDPRPDGVDFVEIYNSTGLHLTLKDWQIANAADADVITEDELILYPASFMVFTEDKSRLMLDYPQAVGDNIVEVSSLPTFANNEGVVKIIDELGRVQDSLFYSDDYHNALLADVEGVSLERIDFTAPNNADNWTSASSTIGFATPGFTNSQERGEVIVQDAVEADPKVFVPGSGTASFTTINYDFGVPGQFANITLFDQNGRLVRTLAEGLALSSSGFVTWDGTNDGGAVVRMGYYLIVFEVYSANGSSEIVKETVVVGRDF